MTSAMVSAAYLEFVKTKCTAGADIIGSGIRPDTLPRLPHGAALKQSPEKPA